jgi:hypothetical protein
MAKFKLARRAASAAAAFLLLAAAVHAQTPPQDHSCTLSIGADYTTPFGDDGSKFQQGFGFQAGGGFEVTPAVEPRRGVTLFIDADFLYARLKATMAAVEEAKSQQTQLASATGAHGGFAAVTLDPTLRYPLTVRTSLYLLGGFGWFRRGINFNGSTQPNLLRSTGSTLGRLSANSGVFDVGGGVNFGLTRKGGLMLYAEARVYRALAVNSGTTLVPLSVGLRW